MPRLVDPLLVCREVLLAHQALADEVGGRVYATPDLPPGHSYPCIRLTHIATADHSPVGFRHAATATVQMDVWAVDMATLTRISEHALDVLTGTPAVPGSLFIRVAFEAREFDETAQPPLYRYRADLSVRTTTIQ